MTRNAIEIHQACVQRFIDLANDIKNEGTDLNAVSGALMSASALYASYVAAGNTGGLTESGVEKVSEIFKKELSRIQLLKKRSLAEEGSAGA